MVTNKKNFEKQAMDFETSLSYIAKKSTRNAWILAFISVFISAVAVVAVCFLTPLKSVEPYIIKVDQTTGLVDIVTKMDEKDITTTEAIDKHFISQYVKAREGYYFDMLQHDYVFVQLLSMPEVSKDYMALYQGENARDVKLNNSYVVEPNILSVVLGDSAGVKIATIRTKLKIIDKAHGGATVEKTIVVSLSYDYFTSAIREADRLNNPLGFKVLNYRVDEEIVK